MKKVISIVVCALFAFVALAGMAMAQAKPAAPAPAAPAKPVAPAAAPAPPPAAMSITDYTGKVEKGKTGLVLKTAGGEYALAGMDLSKMVGNKVVATGTVAEKGGMKILTVTAVKEAK